MKQERKDYYRGSALFYKAVAYLDLIYFWGDCVLVEEEIPLESREKSYWTTVADHAIELAEEAVRLLPDFDKVTDSQGNATTYKSVPCKGAANAVLAYLAAWKAGCKWMAQPSERNYDEAKLWEKAEQACTDIIGSEQGEATGCYRLAANPEKVCTQVLVGGSAESIYESVYVGFWDDFGPSWKNLVDQAPLFQTWPMLNYGKREVKEAVIRVKTETVRKMYEEGDLRRDAYFYAFEEMASPDSVEITGGFAYPYKWREVAVETSGPKIGEYLHINQNYIWWRLADIYLLRAECRARLNKKELAIADINVVRDRAQAKRYNASEYAGNLQMAVFKEREKELIFEGYRYLDIVRNNYVRSMLGSGYRTLSEQDYIDGALFWALGTFAFYNNPKMRQNTYWKRFE